MISRSPVLRGRKAASLGVLILMLLINVSILNSSYMGCEEGHFVLFFSNTHLPTCPFCDFKGLWSNIAFSILRTTSNPSSFSNSCFSHIALNSERKCSLRAV